MKKALFCFLLCFSCTFFVVAQEQNEEPVSEKSQNLAKKYFLEGKAAYDKGDYAKALELFRLSLFEDPQNPVLNHLMGRAAFELGRFEEALFAFERVLVLNPNLALSRLEKARTHLALGSKLEAKEEFNRVLEADIPPQVRTNVEALLAQIGSERKHEVSGVVLLSHLWDSNATLGTGALPLAFLSLLAEPTAQSDRVSSAALVLNHKYPLAYEGWAWKNNLTGFLSDNTVINSNDLFLGVASTGLEFAYKRHVFDLSFAWTGINLNQHTYQSSTTGALKYSYAFSPRVTLRAGTSYTRRHHFAPSGPDAVGTEQTFGFNSAWDLGCAFLQDESNSWDLGFAQKFDKSPRDGLVAQSYHRNELNLRYTRVLAERWMLNISATRRQDDYRTEDLFLWIKRSDMARIGSVGITFKITPKILFDVGGSYTDNDSNIPQNTYMVKQATISLTALFGP